MLFRIWEFAQKACAIAGAVRGRELIAAAGAGDSFDMMACIDRLVELGLLTEALSQQIKDQIPWQHGIYYRRGE